MFSEKMATILNYFNYFQYLQVTQKETKLRSCLLATINCRLFNYKA